MEGVEIKLFFCDILSLSTCSFTVEWQLPGVGVGGGGGVGSSYVYVQEAAKSTNTLKDLNII